MTDLTDVPELELIGSPHKSTYPEVSREKRLTNLMVMLLEVIEEQREEIAELREGRAA